MKKYLMSGIAALALCAAFTSCSKNDLYDEGAIQQQKETSAREAYAAAFEKAFGKVGANVDWGFGSSRANTRTFVDPNGNLWVDPPTVLAEEPQEVKDYVEALTSLPMDKPTNLTDYFVTHIWKGTDTYKAFTDGDNVEPFTGSDIMDQLIIASKEDSSIDPGQGTLNAGANEPGASGSDAVWQHVYDFNAGENRDYSGNMLMKDSGTKNFAYWNSKDNKWHDRWIAVKGSDIDAYYGFTGENAKYSGYWYICFDYEGTPKENSESFTVVSWKVPGNNPGEYFEQKMKIQGIHTLESLAKAGTELSDNQTGRVMGTYTVGQEGTIDWHIDQISQGDKYTPGDGVYTDWIIRLVDANPIEEPETHYYRVIAEDLNATEASDFDFNDVVFDVIPNEAKNGAKIVLRAAGGIYKLTVGNERNGVVEVHEAFAAAYPDAGYGKGADDLYPMINTNPWNPEVKVTLFENYAGDFSDASIRNTIKDIKIIVYKPGSGENGWLLTATTGEAACKILVDDTFDVVTERHGIADVNTNFHMYVQGYWDRETEGFWWRRGTAGN